MDWRIKAAVQGILSRIPCGTSLNDVLQRVTGGRRDEAAHVRSKVHDDWLVHQNILRDLEFSVQGKVLLEVGTGWLPIFPLCYALAGAARCHTFDLHRHLDMAKVPIALAYLEEHLGTIASACGDSLDLVRSRWKAFGAAGSGQEILAAANIDYRAPANAASTGFSNASVSLVFSNSVLEHVSETVLGALMRESARILQPDGLALHSVNCGDHYAYFDRNITPIHYLRFDDRTWRRWNNGLLYQNRLRPLDFIDAARSGGLEIVRDLQNARRELLKRLHELPIDSKFEKYTPEQICTTSVTFAGRPSAH